MLLSAPLGNLEAQTTAADRLANIEKLLNQSSGAKQVINSGNSEAQLKRREALDAYRQAQQKIASGNEQASTDLLNQSTRLMFEAIKLSTPTSLGEGKNIDNYGQRRESVIALQDAFNRISDENHETETRGRVNDQLATLVNQADSLLQRGKNTEARIEIDKAYHLLKVSIESIIE
jgi:hypothetical protein